MIFRLFLFLTILILTCSSPSLEAQQSHSTLILNTLNQINLKMDKLIDDLSNTNQRMSRLEEWKTITEVKIGEVEKKTVRQEAYLNHTRGVGLAILGVWAFLVHVVIPKLRFKKGTTK